LPRRRGRAILDRMSLDLPGMASSPVSHCPAGEVHYHLGALVGGHRSHLSQKSAPKSAH